MGDSFPLLYPTVVSTIDLDDDAATTVGTEHGVMPSWRRRSVYRGWQKTSTRGVGAGIHQSSRAYADDDDGMTVISKDAPIALVTFPPATRRGDFPSSLWRFVFSFIGSSLLL
jgi:hypothetical protein